MHYPKDDLQNRVLTILSKAGDSLEKIAANPSALEKACDYVYAVLPLPLRLLGRERIRGVILKLAGRIAHQSEDAGADVPKQDGASLPEPR